MLRPGGLPAAEAVAQIVRDLGYAVGEVEIDHEHECWEFGAEAEGLAVHLTVNHIDPDVTIVVQHPTGCLLPVSARKAEFQDFVQRLLERLASDD